MKYDELNLGECVRYADVKNLLGDELTFADLVREPGTNKLFVWIGATVGGELQDESEFLIAQVLRVVDFDPEEDTEPGDEEWATVMLDIPGFSNKPVVLEFEDLEAPELEAGDDPNRLSNMYHRIWRVKKQALQPLERLALGAAIYSKCKANYIDTTEELLDALSSGLAKTVFSSQQLATIKTVLHNAHIDIPEPQEAAPEKQEEKEELKQELDVKTDSGTDSDREYNGETDRAYFGKELTYDELTALPEGTKVLVYEFAEKTDDDDDIDAELYEAGAQIEGYPFTISRVDSDDTLDEFKILPQSMDPQRDNVYTRVWLFNGTTQQSNQETPSDPFTRAKALHQRIVNDAQAAAESVWDLCQAIKEMRDGKHYKFLLYDNFEGYCECELGMSRSHAYRYIQIAEGMSAENVASMRQIGTTKLALLASVTEEQREIITTAVDVESATVKELKAQIDELKGKVSEAEKKAMLASGRATEAEKARDNAQARYVKSDNQNLVLKDTIASKDKIIEGKNISMENLRVDNAQLKDRVRELESGRDHVLAELETKIKELESRPVEVAVQDNSEELEQLRAEYEQKLAEAAADNEYKEVLAMCRLARQQVDAVCIRLKGIRAGKAKDSLIKYTKEIGLLLGQLN